MCNRTEQRKSTLEYFSFWVNFYDSQLWFILYESYGRKLLELVPWNFKLSGVFGDSWIDEKIKTFNNLFSYKQIIFIIVTHINQMFGFIHSCFSIIRRKLKYHLSPRLKKFTAKAKIFLTFLIFTKFWKKFLPSIKVRRPRGIRLRHDQRFDWSSWFQLRCNSYLGHHLLAEIKYFNSAITFWDVWVVCGTLLSFD